MRVTEDRVLRPGRGTLCQCKSEPKFPSNLETTQNLEPLLLWTSFYSRKRERRKGPCSPPHPHPSSHIPMGGPRSPSSESSRDCPSNLDAALNCPPAPAAAALMATVQALTLGALGMRAPFPTEPASQRVAWLSRDLTEAASRKAEQMRRQTAGGICAKGHCPQPYTRC